MKIAAAAATSIMGSVSDRDDLAPELVGHLAGQGEAVASGCVVAHHEPIGPRARCGDLVGASAARYVDRQVVRSLDRGGEGLADVDTEYRVPGRGEGPNQ